MAESKSEKSCERLFPTSWQFPRIAIITGAWLAIWHVWLHMILHKCHVLISFILLFPTLTCVFFARNLFEKLQRATVSVKRAEKRSDIEDISLRENVSETYTRFCWVHGGDMVAHGLTKFGEKHKMFDRIAEIREGKEKTGHDIPSNRSRTHHTFTSKNNKPTFSKNRNTWEDDCFLWVWCGCFVLAGN